MKYLLFDNSTELKASDLDFYAEENYTGTLTIALNSEQTFEEVDESLFISVDFEIEEERYTYKADHNASLMTVELDNLVDDYLNEQHKRYLEFQREFIEDRSYYSRLSIESREW